MAYGLKTGGRRKGTPNKITGKLRAGLATFVDLNFPKLQTRIDAIAAKDPAKAADLLLRALGYCVPRIARMEVATELEKPEQAVVRIEFVEPPKRAEPGSRSAS